MKKIVASNLRLVGTAIDPNQDEEEILDVLLSIINTEMNTRGYDVKVVKTEDTDTYSYVPDKPIKQD